MHWSDSMCPNNSGAGGRGFNHAERLETVDTIPKTSVLWEQMYNNDSYRSYTNREGWVLCTFLFCMSWLNMFAEILGWKCYLAWISHLAVAQEGHSYNEDAASGDTLWFRFHAQRHFSMETTIGRDRPTCFHFDLWPLYLSYRPGWSKCPWARKLTPQFPLKLHCRCVHVLK